MRLADYLATNDIKPVNFAGRVGVDRSTVSRWLDGSLKPGWKMLVLIARETAGQVTANDFVDGQEPIPNPNEPGAGGGAAQAAE